MVVFTCNVCGDALKKAQVEKHCQTKCRSCNVLSCLDCGKDFWGNDYEQHTKCVSEMEKYSGKNYVPKANANKGEVKQLAWLEQVQHAIDKVKTNPKLRDLLERMKDYPNIPRKKNKFENFLGNSLRVWDKSLAANVWDLLMANTATKPTNNSNTDQNSTNQSDPSNSDNVTNHVAEDPSHSNDSEKLKKLSKRERKEERRKQSHKVEKKEKQVNEETHIDNEENESGRANKSKKKKRKHAEEETETQSRKRKREEPEEVEENGTEEEVEEDSEPEKKRHDTKFDWEDVITHVLRAKGSEMAIKRVKKKVLAEYLAQGCTEKSEVKLWAKFDRKLRKNPAFKIVKDRVKLVS